jgi:prolyl oligopeptidase
LTFFKYPPARKSDQVDDYHGTPVPDPYRWLEDTDSPETRAWIEAQNTLTFSYLESLPEREVIRKRLNELWDYAKVSAPYQKAGRYFHLRNSGLQNQDVLYVIEVQAGNLQIEGGRILLDPNTLSSDGTVALVSWAVSEDGRWLAFATSASGSDWLTWRVRSVDSGEDLPEIIEWSKFSGAAWLDDSSGFYYSCYEAPQENQEFLNANYYQKLYFHRLSTPQAQDRLVYERPDQKEWGFGAEVSQDGRYLVLSVSVGTDPRNLLFYQDLQIGGEVVELISELEASYVFVGNDGPDFYLKTDLDAPRGRLVAVDVTNPDKAQWREFIPQQDWTLEQVKLVADQFVCLVTQDACQRLLRYGLDGTFLSEIDLPTLGSIIALNGERKDSVLYYTFTSFTYPGTVFAYNFSEGRSQLLFAPAIQFDFTVYTTRQVFVTSKDGTRLPLFLVYRNDLPGGPQPALLYGYGGFNISLTPSFSISRLAWLERGGILAVANLRGGNEYGEEWHQAGTKERKQNVFDDFIACAEWLIDQSITNSSLLAIQGGSNGGLLVGACMAQRPDLFAAAQPAVGVMDMLRFHKFTIGWAWVSDYGSSDDPEGFKYLVAYSPLHNLQPGKNYPATLVTTADHDDRVVPGHSFKFAATLQEAQTGDAPVLIRIQTKAGHGFGKPTAVIIEEQADIWAFLLKALSS